MNSAANKNENLKLELQGLGNLWTVCDLCQLIKEKRPNCLFLMETKSNKLKMERLRVRMGFEGLFAVDLMGRSGGNCFNVEGRG